jgi:hypothetical protein
MTQLAPEERYAGWKLEDQHPEFPHDAERFAVGLEDDRKLHRAWLIAGVLSEVGLVGLLITSLQEPGRAASVVLVVVVAGLGLAMGVHAARFRTDGQPRIHCRKRHASRRPRQADRSGFQPAGREDARRLGRPIIAKAPPWHQTAYPAAGSGNR